MVATGVNLPEELIDELDEKKRDWDERDIMTVSRSDVAREALSVGIVALDELDDHNRALDNRARRAIVRQALQDHFDKEG